MVWCDKEESEEKRRRKQAYNEISLLGNYEISFNRVGFRFRWVQVMIIQYEEENYEISFNHVGFRFRWVQVMIIQYEEEEYASDMNEEHV